MVEMKNTLVCPFCKGAVRIVVCDSEGNIHPEEYEIDPFSGLGYKLMHEQIDVPNKKHCPIATYEEDELCQGSWIYDSREEATEAWNID